MDPRNFNLGTIVYPPASLATPYFHIYDFHWGYLPLGSEGVDWLMRRYAITARLGWDIKGRDDTKRVVGERGP